MFNKALILALALVLLPAPIAAKSTWRSEKALQDNLREYGLAVRWNDFEAAAEALDPVLVQGDRFSEQDEEYYKVFQISGYQLKSSAMLDPLTYSQRVELRIIDRDTQVERIKTDRQNWRYDVLAKRWWLTSGLPKLD
ncbi:MAG TPA: hypothetical protein VN248_02800 [Arenimonas sp.]|nr:hypothetical protein [Arenimonas sp.]